MKRKETVKIAYTVFILKRSGLKSARSFGYALKGQPQKFIGPLCAEVAGFYYSDPLIRLVPGWYQAHNFVISLSRYIPLQILLSLLQNHGPELCFLLLPPLTMHGEVYEVLTQPLSLCCGQPEDKTSPLSTI